MRYPTMGLVLAAALLAGGAPPLGHASLPPRAAPPMPVGADPAPRRIAANDNRAAAGTLRDGALVLRLEVVRGTFYPDADTDPGAEAVAFAEEGHAPSIPGPLVRVPVGTRVRTTIHNTLPDSSVIVVGLSGARGLADTAWIRPGETRELETRATSPGTFFYRGLMHWRDETEDARVGGDAMLGGAFVVDAPGAPTDDRVFVMFQWLDRVRLKPLNAEGTDELLTINGKSWPHTERPRYRLGDTIRWRIINASFDTHPMHLHGAYFRVLGRGDVSRDTVYAPAQRRQVVTERMAPMTTMDLEWLPPHAGHWLFHCHLNFHIMAHTPLGPRPPDGTPVPADHSMGGLVLGTIVDGPVSADPVPRRRLRLVVEEHDSVPGDFVPPFSYQSDDAGGFTVPGAPIIVTRDEPVAITVVNRASEPTTVHWHGLEIQSYYDGVAGFDGDATRTAPVVAAHDSFVAVLTPPRAGTFIYHTHFDDIRQQGGGLYGAFIVLPPGRRWDAAHERVVVFGEARDTGALKINGVDHPTLEMTRGRTYRVRLINITLERPNLVVWLKKDGKLLDWRLVARDGADLPAAQALTVPARLPLTIGQTEDALFTPAAAGDYVLEARSGGGKLLRSARIVVREGATSGGKGR